MAEGIGMGGVVDSCIGVVEMVGRRGGEPKQPNAGDRDGGVETWIGRGGDRDRMCLWCVRYGRVRGDGGQVCSKGWEMVGECL